jgi:hypothetical protein
MSFGLERGNVRGDLAPRPNGDISDMTRPTPADQKSFIALPIAVQYVTCIMIISVLDTSMQL